MLCYDDSPNINKSALRPRVLKSLPFPVAQSTIQRLSLLTPYELLCLLRIFLFTYNQYLRKMSGRRLICLFDTHHLVHYINTALCIIKIKDEGFLLTSSCINPSCCMEQMYAFVRFTCVT